MTYDKFLKKVDELHKKRVEKLDELDKKVLAISEERVLINNTFEEEKQKAFHEYEKQIAPVL